MPKVQKALSRLRNLVLGATALCLAVSFGLALAGSPSVDRLSRQQQRARVQRYPRQRMCPGISQEPCALQAAFNKVRHVSDPPAVPPGVLDGPVLTFVALIEPSPISRPATPSLPDSQRPRPPPALA